MDPLTSAAAAGLRARIESLDLLANNIANSGAAGYKADREFYGLYLSSEANTPDDQTSANALPVVERQWTDFAQGSLSSTGSPLDVALNGLGFFVASAGSGPVFTRGGSFRLSSQGILQTMDGYALQDSTGRPIRVDASKPMEVAPDGVIRQEGQEIAQIKLVDFSDPSVLMKRGSNYFQTDSNSIAQTAHSVEVQQGKLESANSQPAESAVRLVNILRQFEGLQKAMNIGAEMNRSAIQEVAKTQ